MSCFWSLSTSCERIWTNGIWKILCSLYSGKQQAEIFYWSWVEGWLVFEFRQVAMEDLHWMQSRTFNWNCETHWELSPVDHGGTSLFWLDFSCDRSEVCEFYFWEWFEKVQSWYLAFHVWQWWCWWLYSQGTRNKATKTVWIHQVLHFEDTKVGEGWLWFVLDFQWCDFDLWWPSLWLFWDCGSIPIFGISFCQSNKWTQSTSWNQNLQLA